MRRRLLRSRAVTALAGALAASYLQLAFRTTRWQFSCPDRERTLLATEPVIVAFWHERLLLMPVLWRLARAGGHRAPGADVLISRHHDGVLIARAVSWFGARAVHGSSSGLKAGRTTERGGAAALRRLALSLRSGRHVLVTPDGPRGPSRSAKHGLAHLAALSGRPVLPAAASTTRCWRLPTWDRTMVPLPFGRGHLVVGPAIPVEPGADRDSANRRLAAALDEALARSDRRHG